MCLQEWEGSKKEYALGMEYAEGGGWASSPGGASQPPRLREWGRVEPLNGEGKCSGGTTLAADHWGIQAGARTAWAAVTPQQQPAQCQAVQPHLFHARGIG